MKNAPEQLSRIQKKIRRWVHQDKLSAEVNRWIVNEPPLEARHRVKVYARAWRARLSEGIANDLKVTRKLLGARKFDQLVRDYLDVYPSRSYSLFDLNHRLPRFLKARRWDQWVHDLALLEISVDHARTAKDPVPIPVEKLLASTEGKSMLRLRLCAPVTLVASRYPLKKIWSKKSSRFLKAGSLQYFVVFRSGLATYVDGLTKNQYRILKSLDGRGRKLTNLIDEANDPVEFVEYLSKWSRFQIIEVSQI